MLSDKDKKLLVATLHEVSKNQGKKITIEITLGNLAALITGAKLTAMGFLDRHKDIDPLAISRNKMLDGATNLSEEDIDEHSTWIGDMLISGLLKDLSLQLTKEHFDNEKEIVDAYAATCSQQYYEDFKTKTNEKGDSNG